MNKEQLDNVGFFKLNKCHDWRNYVLDEHRLNWHTLSTREKEIVYLYCKVQADNEEWI